MEELRLGKIPSEVEIRTRHNNPNRGEEVRLVIDFKEAVGMVWQLLPTERETYRFNRIILKESEKQGREIGQKIYWLSSGIYMVDHWDGQRIHRSYLRAVLGRIVALYSVTLSPVQANNWIREQFPR